MGLEDEKSCLSDSGYYRELEALLGRTYAEVDRLRRRVQRELSYADEERRRFAESESGRMQATERLSERCESLEKDLKEALSRANVSDVGATTPNPFPQTKHKG